MVAISESFFGIKIPEFILYVKYLQRFNLVIDCNSQHLNYYIKKRIRQDSFNASTFHFNVPSYIRNVLYFVFNGKPIDSKFMRQLWLLLMIIFMTHLT